MADETIVDVWDRRAKLLNSVGVPVIALLWIGWMIWRGTVWAAPIAESIAKQHIESLQQMGSTQTEIVGTQKQIASSIDKQAENGRELVEMNRKHLDITGVLSKQIDDVHRAIVRPKPEDK
jgi:hypothetical protein